MADGIRILYVDDEPELLDLAKTFLENAGGFEIGTSTSAEEVLDILPSQPCEVIVSDYQMPGMNGIDFLKQVRERFGDLPFILFTGRGREEVVIDAINNGADFYLQKGGSPRAQFAELAHKIHQAVARRRAQVELRNAYDRITASEEELARIEEQIRESETKFRDLADRLPQMVFETDLDLRITYVNRYTIATYGFPVEALERGISILSFVHPTQHATFLESVEKIRNGIPFEPKEYLVFNKEGRQFPVTVYSSPIFHNKRLVGFRGVAVDISDRKRAEEALRESENKFSTIFRSSQIALTLLSAGDSTFFDVNDSFLRNTGYSRDEVIGKTPYDLGLLVEPDSADRIAEALQSPGHIDGMEVKFRIKNGAMITSLYSATIITMGGKPYVLSSVIDISGRKTMEEALRQANKKLNILSGITRHDINNQLVALDGYIELLRERIRDPSSDGDFSRILATTSRITNLIRFTKEYEMIGLNAPVWQDIRALADQAGKDAEPGTVTIVNDLAAGTEIFADPLISKVFFNLVDNALRHGGAITEIRFSVEERGGDRVIVCADNGGGIAAEEKEKIFDLGFGKNTGFGLAISREILDITGITITENGMPGKGARFEITVPAGQVRAAP
jgi:PAS domain S-box-containing protein